MYARNVVAWVAGAKTMRKAGAIRSAKMAIFSEVQQLFFAREAVTSATFDR